LFCFTAIPSVGSGTALASKALVDEPTRSTKSKIVAAHFELTVASGASFMRISDFATGIDGESKRR
jgi:hypothetical protein